MLKKEKTLVGFKKTSIFVGCFEKKQHLVVLFWYFRKSTVVLLTNGKLP